MRQMGQKHMVIELQEPVAELPASLAAHHLELAEDGLHLTYTYDTTAGRTGITSLLNDLNDAGMALRDVQTSQSSLEEIFVGLVKNGGDTTAADNKGQAA